MMTHCRPALSALALVLAGCGESGEPIATESANRQETAGDAVSAGSPEPAEGATPEPVEPEAPAAAAPAWSASGYRLIGTEPFWGGTAGPDEIVYSTPENQAGEPIAVTARLEDGRETYSGRLGGRPFVLTLTPGPCSDGMSDNVHAFTATLEVNGETRRGCADPRA